MGYNSLGKEVMPVPQIYEDNNVDAHILYGEKEPQVHCYDLRRGFMEVEVVIDLLLRLPVGYGEEPKDFPSPEFVIEALQSVLRHHETLWTAWSRISTEF